MLQQTLTFIQTPPLTKIFVGQVSQKERRKPKNHIQKVRHKKMLKIILYFLVVKKKSSSSELNYHIQVTISLNRNSSISLLILKQFLKNERILSAQIA